MVLPAFGIIISLLSQLLLSLPHELSRLANRKNKMAHPPDT